MLDELDGRYFLLVHTEREHYYRQPDALFGDEVNKVFGGDTGEDISEAGKCYALGRYTATVFHLMRAMERAIHVLSEKLGATVTNKHGDFLS